MALKAFRDAHIDFVRECYNMLDRRLPCRGHGWNAQRHHLMDLFQKLEKAGLDKHWLEYDETYLEIRRFAHTGIVK